jgi:hypothetical protein
MPSRADLDVLELRQWLGNLHLVEVVEEGRDFFHRVYGTELALAFGVDLTGKGMSAVPDDLRERARREYAQVYRSGSPLVVDNDPIVRSAIQRVEKIILPLSTDGRSVDRLLIGAFPSTTAAGAQSESDCSERAMSAARRARANSDPSAAERRRARRVAVRWGAVVEVASERLSCTVVDYSRDGAKLEVEREIAGEQPLVIMLGRRGTRRGKVVWQRAGELGVEFLHRRRSKSRGNTTA